MMEEETFSSYQKDLPDDDGEALPRSLLRRAANRMLITWNCIIKRAGKKELK